MNPIYYTPVMPEVPGNLYEPKTWSVFFIGGELDGQVKHVADEQAGKSLVESMFAVEAWTPAWFRKPGDRGVDMIALVEEKNEYGERVGRTSAAMVTNDPGFGARR